MRRGQVSSIHIFLVLPLVEKLPVIETRDTAAPRRHSDVGDVSIIDDEESERGTTTQCISAIFTVPFETGVRCFGLANCPQLFSIKQKKNYSNFYLYGTISWWNVYNCSFSWKISNWFCDYRHNCKISTFPRGIVVYNITEKKSHSSDGHSNFLLWDTIAWGIVYIW